ncbi:MAG TPA: hypothetical protein VFK69_10420 [Candidatus Eisenbacteria bacterium]|nr:hypothetical protein [Candidatus Eisenbacteria bacterium]
MNRSPRRHPGWPIIALALGLLCARRADAVLDIDDRGPVLQAGNFVMRVTNAGILGNAFFSQGLSFDPSFEYPKGSGHECLNHAELWVGGRFPDGHVRVSGGPMLEWRPTLDPNDRVIQAWAGDRGTRRGVDDDGDGKVDEEILNGKDDDGDGEIDEDVQFAAQQVLAADYTDDQPAAIDYGYPNGEHHEPFGLSVHQECYAWPTPGFDGVAGVTFTITNHGTQIVRDVMLGVYADLDSRGRNQPAGHLDDAVTWVPWSSTKFTGISSIALGPGVLEAPNNLYVKNCFETASGVVPVLHDASPLSTAPVVTLLGLDHTIDPLAQLTNFAFPGVHAARDAARAPARDTTFHAWVFAQDLPPGHGGPPVLDEDRYAALRGRYPTLALADQPHDDAVLLSCGPFPHLDPGQSVSFSVAFVAAASMDSIGNALTNARYLYRGTDVNLLPDRAVAGYTNIYNVGETGTSGHEICLAAPQGLTFHYDPHCPAKIYTYVPPPIQDPGVSAADSTYTHDHCIWTDLDCDACTGLNGSETTLHWLNPGLSPPPPGYHVSPGDHDVTIAWDNMPEILERAGIVTSAGFHFAGYHLYRLTQWKRESELPPPAQWELIGAFGTDTLNRQTPLASIVDTTVGYDYIRFGQKHYPIGRYRVVDHKVLDGFDHLYVLTSLAERLDSVGTATRIERLESPLIAAIDSVVVPHTAARAIGQTWVVPNPYRGGAPWDRPPVPGDPFGRHVDFMGLPKAPATIRIYTVAGDLVQSIEHDGSNGDGEAAWNLISRNGQDIESGIYLFTVDSSLGHQIGRFVVIR